MGLCPGAGIRREDGTIDRTVPASGTAAVILTGAQDREAAWEFVKWWTEAETQTRYALDLEALMGAAAYPAANPETLRNLPWPWKTTSSLRRSSSGCGSTGGSRRLQVGAPPR